MNTRNSAKKTAAAGLMTALALIFSYIEVLIPFNFGIPGIKLGIANLVVIIALYRMGCRYAFGINIVRVLVAGLLFSGLFGAVYSLAGALMSFAVMVLAKKAEIFSVTGVSMAGGVAHNLGQILVATALVENIRIFVYFPVLIFSGVASGAIIGIISYFMLRRIPQLR